MNKYKWLNEDETFVHCYDLNITFNEGSSPWRDFQKYLEEGGSVDPWKTEEELYEMSLRDKLTELKNYLDSLSVSIIPPSRSKNQAKMIARMVKLLRKEVQGRASQNEVEELNRGELLDDYLDGITDCYDDAERWLEDSARSLAEIENYDVTVDPQWPILGVY